MACLNINIERVSTPPIKATMSKVGGISAFASAPPSIRTIVTTLPSSFDVAVTNATSTLSIAVARVGQQIQARSSIVCGGVIDSPYLVVAEGIILLEIGGYPVSVAVQSNTTWSVYYKSWEDGNLYVSYEGNKNGVATFSADVNEGIDRETSVIFRANGISAERKIVQSGMREEFLTSDSFVFNSADGVFGVLKKSKLYTELSYIESTGTQYIDTGMLSTAQSRASVRFSFNEENGSNFAIFGGRDARDTKSFTFFLIRTATPPYFRLDINKQIKIASGDDITIRSNHIYQFDYEGENVAINNDSTGEEIITEVEIPTTYTTNTIHLFCVNSNGTQAHYIKGKIFRFTYTDGTNSIDLIPVIDSCGIVCMYDKISETFFYNQGTGEFIAGEILKK